MGTGGPARTVGRFLFACVVVLLVSPFWFYPDPTGIVPAVGFFLTPLGALVLVAHGFETRRLGLFCLAHWVLVFPVGIIGSLAWSSFVRLVAPASLASSVVVYVASSFVPVALVYAIAYWLVYRGGYARLRASWT